MAEFYSTLYIDDARALRDALHAKGRPEAIVMVSGISSGIWIAIAGDGGTMRPLTMVEAARV